MAILWRTFAHPTACRAHLQNLPTRSLACGHRILKNSINILLESLPDARPTKPSRAKNLPEHLETKSLKRRLAKFDYRKRSEVCVQAPQRPFSSSSIRGSLCISHHEKALPLHAKGIMTESVQPQGNKPSFAFSLSLAAGACVRVCLVRPPHAPSLRRCPQLSTLVRDHRRKSLCSREVGCLAKCPNQTQAQLGGGGPMEVWVAPFPSEIEGLEHETLAGSPQ